MEIAAGLSALKTASDLLRTMREAAKAGSLRPEEFAGRIAELYDYIGDSKEAVLSAQEALNRLTAENDQLKTIVFHHSVCWRVLPDGGEDGPFCPTCEGEGVRMRLLLRSHIDQTGEMIHMHCPKSHFETGPVRDPGRGREPSYPIPKDLIPKDRYLISS